MFDFGEGWEGTWLYQVPSALWSVLGAAGTGIAVVVVLVVLGSLYMARYVVKGGGQYGIIEGYVGTIGAGKTTLAVQHALALARARNAVLLSNIPVRCGKRCGGQGFRNVIRLPGPNGELDDRHCVIEHDVLPMTDDGLDLGELTRRAFVLRDQERGLVLLMDEVGVVMPARLWKDFSVALMWLLQQSRKLACEWVWTAQDPSFVDHQLRSLTAVVHYVRSYPPPSIWRRAKGKRPWVLVSSAYTPTAAPRANGEQSSRLAQLRLGRRVFRYRRRWEASFDTDGVVLPSKHLRGAEQLHDSVIVSDRHVIAQGAELGPRLVASEEPSEPAARLSS